MSTEAPNYCRANACAHCGSESLRLQATRPTAGPWAVIVQCRECGLIATGQGADLFRTAADTLTTWNHARGQAA